MSTKSRFILTGVLVAAYILFRVLYAPFDNLIRAQAGVGQLTDSIALTGIALWFSQHSIVPVITWIFLGLVGLLWLPWFLKNGSKSALSVLILLAFAMPILSGCVPYKGSTVVEVGPNQTAFMLPAQGDTAEQAKFNSAQYLQEKEVAAKIVEITFRPHKTGRMYWSVDFVPNNILILVDRKPVSRQWTYNKETGTSDTNQAIALESQESIGFYHGVVVNAVIEEVDAATFLYYYGGAGIYGDPAQTGIQASVGLEQVMDSFVRTWVANKLYAEFKSRTLEQGQIDAAKIFAGIEESAKVNFKKYGVTILDLGGIEGLVYDSDSVQESIDQKFKASAVATAQAITNNMTIEKSSADAQAAVNKAEGEAKAMQMTGEQLARYPSIVNKILAEASTGQVPQVLVIQDSGTMTGTVPFPFWFFYPQPTSPNPPQ